MKDDFIVVMMTVPSVEEGVRIGKELVDDRLVACCNLIPSIRSIYRWKGEVCDETEALCVFKTTAINFEAIKARVAELHPYEVPELIALSITDGLPPYLAWILESTVGTAE